MIVSSSFYSSPNPLFTGKNTGKNSKDKASSSSQKKKTLPPPKKPYPSCQLRPQLKRILYYYCATTICTFCIQLASEQPRL